MGYVLWIVLLAVEVGFFIGSLWTKKTHKIEKSITNLGLAVLFLISLTTPILTWGFRYYILAVYIFIKCIFSLITVINKKEGKYSTFKSIRTFILSTLLISIFTMPAILFPEFDEVTHRGAYEVLSSKYTWIDDSRLDEYQNNEVNRSLTVEFWYPEDDSKTYPLVIFSHGAFGYSGSNYSTFMQLASSGYVVASIGHTHQAFFTKDTFGKLTIVDQGFISQAIEINAMIDTQNEALVFETTQAWMKLRTEDMNFVLDQIIELTTVAETETLFQLIDITKIGVFGHSLGGATAAQIGRLRNDVDAVIVLDGTMLGEEVDFTDGEVVLNEQPYPVPLLNIYAEDHYQNALTHVGDAYNNFYATAHAVEAYETVFLDAGHLNFTDLPLFSPILAGLLGIGSIDERYCITQMNDVVVSFFDYYLKDTEILKIEKEY